MDSHDERGMATAEYTIGTLGAVMIAMVLYRLGMLHEGNPWFEAVKQALERALAWHSFKDFIPGFGLRL